MEDERGKNLSSISHILVRDKMGVQDDRVEKETLMSNLTFRWRVHLQSGTTPFDHSYYPHKMNETFV
jgi:hypothetical protein